MAKSPRTCQYCEKEFLAENKDINRGKARFCSKVCADDHTRKHQHNNVQCAFCHTLFYMSDSRRVQSRTGTHFCGVKCKNNAQRLSGISAIHLPHYGTSVYDVITKGDLTDSLGNTGARKRIHKDSLRKYDRSDRPKHCVYCWYDAHYEVCHIRAVSDFPPEALVSDINALSNLVALCPNHHWEFDNGKLQWSDIVEKMSDEYEVVDPDGIEPS